ncbi:MAG: tyrosine-protein phosphatase [Oscillospiraceae bacterium]|nr:tyrosine-protein phosphatase [Oscillospiraceae bacterium]
MERRIVLEGIKNCRDLGGIRIADGREIAPGKLLRCAETSAATEADLEKLRALDVSAVIDLRTNMEKAEKPDRLPAGTDYIPEPVFDEATAGITREDGQPQPFVMPDMVALYRTMAVKEGCRKALGKVMRRILGQDLAAGSILWHCTAGKDRAGIVAALLLGVLGADRETILADYLISNESCAADAENLYRKAMAAGAGEAVAQGARDAFLAKEEYLNAALDAFDEYGGVRDYLVRALGIDPGAIDRFRETMLK